MNKSPMSLPLFPLPVFLLTGGVTKLRIFEPRYLKMVGIASAGQGFVICLNNQHIFKQITNNEQVNSQNSAYWGSWVDIINFDQGKDGILEIEVKCKSLVMVDVAQVGIKQDTDNLHFAEVTPMEHWADQRINDNEIYQDERGSLQGDMEIINEHYNTLELCESLAAVFHENTQLNSLYPDKSLHNIHWVIARWLEVLPIDLHVKNTLVINHHFNDAKAFVESILLKT